MKDPNLRLYHVRDAILLIEEYAAPGQAAFRTESMRRDAIMRNLEIIGEAIRHLPADLRLAVPDIDWDQAIGMRNWLIHGYAVVDLDIVWLAVVDDLPRLKVVVQALLGAKY